MAEALLGQVLLDFPVLAAGVRAVRADRGACARDLDYPCPGAGCDPQHGDLPGRHVWPVLGEQQQGLRAGQSLPQGGGIAGIPGGDLIDRGGEVAQRYGSAAMAYLIRPDGYVGFRCGWSDLSRYLPDHLARLFAPA